MDLVNLRDFDPSAVIERDAPFDHLGFDLRFPRPGTLTYCGSAGFLRQAAASSEVACVLTSEKAYAAYRRKHGELEKGLAFVASPRETFFRFHNFLSEQTAFYRRDEESRIGAGPQISRTAVVSARNVRIGDRVQIADHAVVCDNVTIGDDVRIGAGTVIGGPGFQFLRLAGELLPIAHAGGVAIHDGVEIHAACTVDRAIFREDTEVGPGCRFDNGVHFAHRSRIGKRGLLAAKACICGSVVLGDDVWVGPAAVISDSVVIGDRAQIAIGAVVVRDVQEGEAVAGNFAIDRDLFLERNLQALLPPGGTKESKENK